VIERGELFGQLERFVVGAVDGARQPELVGDRGQRVQHGEGVGPAHHIEIVDVAEMFA
jgi:hypothetical protein